MLRPSNPAVERLGLRTAARCLGNALPCELLRNDAQHVYTLPKNGLLAALSAQICSLSENVVFDCRDTITGGVQALLVPAAAACTLSVRDTAIASKPLNAPVVVAARLE